MSITEHQSLRLISEGTIGQSLTLTKEKIIDLWERGILANATYVYLALSIECQGKIDFDLDIAGFTQRWYGSEDPDTGKRKTLTTDQLLKALADLQKRESLEIKHKQLSLEFYKT